MARNWQALGLPADKVERHACYRARLLEAAEVEFTLHGFSGAKAHLIARRAEVSPSTLSKSFAGKTELWNVVHEERMKSMMSAIRAAPMASDPVKRILDSVRAVAYYLAETPSYLDLQIASGLSWATVDPSDLRPGSDVGQQRSWLTGRDLLVRGIEAANRDHRIVHVRPSVGAAIVISTLQLWACDWVRRGRRESPREMADGLVAYLGRILDLDAVEKV